MMGGSRRRSSNKKMKKKKNKSTSLFVDDGILNDWRDKSIPKTGKSPNQLGKSRSLNTSQAKASSSDSKEKTKKPFSYQFGYTYQRVHIQSIEENGGPSDSMYSTNKVTEDLLKATEELEKLKEETQFNKDHMLQMESAHENFKDEEKGVDPSTKPTSHSAVRPNVPPYPVPMPSIDNDDEISYKARVCGHHQVCYSEKTA